MTKTEMKTAAENHNGAASPADERTVGALRIVFFCIIMAVMFFGWEVLEYFAPAIGVAFLFGTVAVLGAAVAGINIALKKRMTASGYAAWQIAALQDAELVLFLMCMALIIEVEELPAAFAYSAIFFPVVFGVYLAAGMKINGALKKRMTADAYAAWIKEIFQYDIFACCFIGFVTFAAAAALVPALLIYALPISAAVIAAVVIFRALVKKHMTADAYSTLPPMFCLTLIIASSATHFVFSGKAGI
ncbi:MAG: hypothetical protein ACR2P4_07685 [Gammaproteobacteria bacterium]